MLLANHAVCNPQNWWCSFAVDPTLLNCIQKWWLIIWHRVKVFRSSEVFLLCTLDTVYSSRPYPSAFWSKPYSSSHACHRYVTCSYHAVQERMMTSFLALYHSVSPNSRPPMLASLFTSFSLTKSHTNTNKSHTACTQTVSRSGPAQTHQEDNLPF